MKIKNIKKFIRSIILLLLIIFGLSLIITKGTLSHKETAYKTVYVSDGDTLWSIAQSLQESNLYYKNKDVRYIIDDIMNENNLKSSNLLISQGLKIPTV